MNAKAYIQCMVYRRAIEADEAIANECCHRTSNNNIMDDRARENVTTMPTRIVYVFVCALCRDIAYGGAHKPQTHF